MVNTISDRLTFDSDVSLIEGCGTQESSISSRARDTVALRATRDRQMDNERCSDHCFDLGDALESSSHGSATDVEDSATEMDASVLPRVGGRRPSIAFSQHSCNLDTKECGEVFLGHGPRDEVSTVLNTSTPAYPQLLLSMYTLCRAAQLAESERMPATALLESSGITHLCRVCAITRSRRTQLLAHGPLWSDAGGELARRALEVQPYKPVLLVENATMWERCLRLLEGDHGHPVASAILLSEDAAKDPAIEQAAIEQAARLQGIPVVFVQPCDVLFLTYESPKWVKLRLDSRGRLLARVRRFAAKLEQAAHLEQAADEDGAFETRMEAAMEQEAAKEFLAACHRGHVEAIDVFEEKGVELRTVRDKRGRTGLMLAAACGRVKVVRALCGGQEGKRWFYRHRCGASATYEELEEARKAHADYVNATDNEGRTAVMHAVLHNQVRALEEMLTTKPAGLADATLTDGHNVTPLERAIRRGFADAAIKLLQHGAWTRDDTVREAVWARSAYQIAIDKNMDSVVRALYAAHAATAHDGDSGELPGFALLYAIRRRKPACVDALLNASAIHVRVTGLLRAANVIVNLCDANYCDAQGDGRTPLIEAAVAGDASLVRKLMCYVYGWPEPWFGGEKCVDLNVSDRAGMTALMHAAARGFDEVVSTLCRHAHRSEAGLEANLKSRANARTALHFAAHSDVERAAGVRDLCVYAHAKVNERDHCDQTPLHLAADRRNAAIVKELLMQNANVYALDAHGNTPLHLAARAGAKSVVDILLQNGARVDARNVAGDSALHIALLLHHTVDLNFQLGRSKTLDDQHNSADSPVAADSEYDAPFSKSPGSNTHDAQCSSSLHSKGFNVGEHYHKLERGRYTGVVEQLLQHDADLQLQNRDGLEVFSEPLMQQYFALKEAALNRAVHVCWPTWMGGKLTAAVLSCMASLQSARAAHKHPSLKDNDSEESTDDEEGATMRTTANRRGNFFCDSKNSFHSPSRLTRLRSFRCLAMSHASSVVSVGGGVLVRDARVTRQGTSDDSHMHGESDLGQIRVQRAVGCVWSSEVLPTMRALLAVYVLYLCCLMATCVVWAGSSTSGELARALLGLFTHEGPARRKAAIVDANRAIGFEYVAKPSDWYDFVRTTLAEALDDAQPVQWHNDALHPLAHNRSFVSDLGLLLGGTVRFKQWRSQSRACEGRWRSAVGYCYDDSNRRQPTYSRASFSSYQSSSPSTSAYSDAYRWRSGAELDRPGISHPLMLATYPAGGFAVDVDGPGVAVAADTLEASQWIDAATRAVLIEISVYSPNVNLMCRVELSVEFPTSGGGVSRSDANVARLFPYSQGPLLAILEIICGLFALLFASRLAERTTDIVGLLTDPWSLMDLSIFLLSGAYLAAKLDFLLQVGRVQHWLLADGHVPIVRSQKAAERCVLLLAWLCWVAWFRVVEYLRVSRRAAILVLDISTMLADLGVFLAVLAVTCMAFASASYVTLAWQEPQFRTLHDSLLRAFGAAFGEVSYSDLLTEQGEQTSLFIRKILAFLYVLIVLLLLMNMLVAVLIDQKTTRAHVERRWCLIRLQMIRVERIQRAARASRFKYCWGCLRGGSEKASSQPHSAQRGESSSGDGVKLRQYTMLRKLERRILHEMHGSPIHPVGRAFKLPERRKGLLSEGQSTSPSVSEVASPVRKVWRTAQLQELDRCCQAACADLGRRCNDEDERYDEAFLRRADQLYPELLYFEKHHTGASMQYELGVKKRGFLLVASCCRSDWTTFREQCVSDLSDEDLGFVRDRLLADCISDVYKLDALLVTLAVSNLGKIRSLANYVEQQAHVRSIDHNVTLANALVVCPQLLTSYERLRRNRAELARAVEGAVCSVFNLGRFFQCESVPASLVAIWHAVSSLGDSGGQFVLRLALFSGIVRIPRWFETDIFRAAGLRDACEAILKLEHDRPEQVYEKYITRRAAYLGLPPSQIVRLCAMMRLSCTDQTRLLIDAYMQDLEPYQRTILDTELSKTGLFEDNGWTVVIRYGSGLLSTVARLPEKPVDCPQNTSRQEATRGGCACALRKFVQLLVKARSLVQDHAGSGVYTLSVRDLEILAHYLSDTGGTLEMFQRESHFTIEHTGNEGYACLRNRRDLFRRAQSRQHLSLPIGQRFLESHPASPAMLPAQSCPSACIVAAVVASTAKYSYPRQASDSSSSSSSSGLMVHIAPKDGVYCPVPQQEKIDKHPSPPQRPGRPRTPPPFLAGLRRSGLGTRSLPRPPAHSRASPSSQAY